MRLKDLTIFILDDDESTLRFIKRLMRSAGSRNVETFASTEDFLNGEVFKKHSLLIEELLLPGISVADLYRRLKPDSWSYMTIDHI